MEKSAKRNYITPQRVGASSFIVNKIEVNLNKNPNLFKFI